MIITSRQYERITDLHMDVKARRHALEKRKEQLELQLADTQSRLDEIAEEEGIFVELLKPSLDEFERVHGRPPAAGDKGKNPQ